MGCKNTLVYKRTHRGDPDESGIFGIHDCMGRDRGWSFDSVIGVGGKRPWPGHENIAFKINWIGINADKDWTETSKRGPLVSFEHFYLYEEEGPKIIALAPKLFKYMFEDQEVRAVISRSLSEDLQKEIADILMFPQTCPKQNELSSCKRSQRKCRRKQPEPQGILPSVKGRRKTCD